jgi:hypothetical protein
VPKGPGSESRWGLSLLSEIEECLQITRRAPGLKSFAVFAETPPEIHRKHSPGEPNPWSPTVGVYRWVKGCHDH